MATRPGVTPAPPGRRAGASARAQQPITGFFKKATAAEQAAARMEAIAAAAEEAREEAAASGPPPKRAPGRPRKLVLGLLAALEKPPAPKPPPDRGASKPRGDWWHPALIWPILREVAMRGCFATAVAGLVDRFPAVYGALAPTKPLNEDTVRRWFELGSYTKLLPNYREALVRQRGAYKPGDSGRRGVLVDHPAVQQQIIQIL